jgi:hypothetical protein
LAAAVLERVRLPSENRVIGRYPDVGPMTPGPWQVADIGRRHQWATKRIGRPGVGKDDGDIAKISRPFQGLSEALGSASNHFLLM